MTQQCICGIALVPQEDISGFPAYHWARVLHPNDYCAGDVRVFQIINPDPHIPTTWRKRHKVCALESAGACAVFHLVKIKCAANTVRFLIDGIGPMQNGWDTQQRTWSSATWVLRTI